MFVFLINPVRDLADGRFMRGAFVYNSEVRDGAYTIETFLLENVCGNHICWGATQHRQHKIVHKGKSVYDKACYAMAEAFESSDDSTYQDMAIVSRASRHVLGNNREETIASLYGMRSLGLAKNVIDASYTVAEQWEHTAQAPPNSAWGFVHGLTRYSQTLPNTDARHALDTAAGRVLSLAN
jgi:hypothetical protein